MEKYGKVFITKYEYPNARKCLQILIWLTYFEKNSNNVNTKDINAFHSN